MAELVRFFYLKIISHRVTQRKNAVLQRLFSEKLCGFYFNNVIDQLRYGANEILICKPPRVVVIGGELDIFGSTLLWSKYNFILMRLLNT
jgi:hypothetical protein